jgi:hypothetical protein
MNEEGFMEFINEYGLKIAIIFVALLLFLALIIPAFRLFFGIIKNIFANKVLYPVDGSVRKFKIAKTEKNKLDELRNLRQGQTLFLGNNEYIVEYVHEELKYNWAKNIKKKLFNWDQIEFFVKLKSKHY